MLVIPLNAMPQTREMILEFENGDNPPLTLSDFRGYYRSARLYFKSSGDTGLKLYYANPDAAAPKYDIGLVSGEIFSSPFTPATLGPEEELHPSRWWDDSAVSPASRWILWTVLVIVVAGLLIVIAKLLPREQGADRKLR